MANGNELNTQAHLRTWLQWSGPGPESPLYFAGVDNADIKIEGVDAPQLGGIDAEWQFDPYVANRYLLRQTMVSSPDLPKASVTVRERKGGIPRQFLDNGCRFNAYEMVGDCADFSDFLNGWQEYVLVYPRGRITSKGLGDRTTFADSKGLETSLDVTWNQNPYAIGSINMGLQNTITGLEALDIVFINKNTCQDCGINNDGTKWIYAISKAGAAAPMNLSYSVDGGKTWATSAVSVAANAEHPNVVRILGNYIVINSKTAGGAGAGGLYVNTINPLTGVPGSTWTKVTTGFVAAKAANDMQVLGNTLWLVGDGGYIYNTQNPLNGVTVVNAGSTVTGNLNRLSVDREVMVATGAANAAIKSLNGGNYWQPLTSGPQAATAGTAIVAKSKFEYWAGQDNGKIYYTLNGGETWTNMPFNGDGSGSITDMVAPNPEVMFFAQKTATPTARVFAAWNGGYSWTNSGQRIVGLGTFNAANRLAVPGLAADSLKRVNTLAIAGLAGGGTDGQLYIGTANLT